MSRMFQTIRALLFGTIALGCGDDDAMATREIDAAVTPDLGSDAGPRCGCRGELGTLLYDLSCGEGVCVGADLLQCIAGGETQLDEGRCGGGEDMGAGDGGT